MRPGEPILIICHSFPPNYGIGGRRWAKFAKELARRGHPVHVICSAGTPRDQGSLWTRDIQAPNIITHPLPNRYPNVLTRWPVTAFQDKLQYAFWLRMLPLCTNGNWFDRGIFWRAPLLATSEKLIREQGIRNVIVTGAPFSLMAYATELKQRIPDLHLVSDFRDMWTWGNYYGYQNIGAKRLRYEQRLEALVAKLSDKLISPYPAVINHMAEKHGVPNSHLAVVPHTIDPDDLPEPGGRPQDGMFRMIYAGSLYGTKEAERYIELLFQAFERVRENRPDSFAKCRFDLYITDHGTAQLEQQVKDRGLEKVIRFFAPLPPKEILQRIAEADLVLAYLPHEKKDTMVTKLAEVSYLGRPILHIGEAGLVSRTILDRRMGDTITLNDLVAELPRIINGERTVAMDRSVEQEEHLLANITNILLEEVLV